MDKESWIAAIKEAYEADLVYYSQHARREMMEEEYGIIYENEVAEAVSQCEVLEIYENDKPYPSVLIFGRSKSNRPLHIVCAWCAENKTVIVITVYHPDPDRWDAFRKRKS